MTHEEDVTHCIKYQNFVARHIKSTDEVTTDDRYIMLTHMLMGLLSEVGELTSQLKAHLIYNKPLDLSNTDEEIGDISFYLWGLVLALEPLGGSTYEMILEQNMDKLSKRYPDGYSDAAAQERADKVC